MTSVNTDKKTHSLKFLIMIALVTGGVVILVLHFFVDVPIHSEEDKSITDFSQANHTHCVGLLVKGSNGGHCYGENGDYAVKHNATGWWKA